VGARRRDALATRSRVNTSAKERRSLKDDKLGFYIEIIRTVFQAIDAKGKLRHRVVAFTSATPGEGVSHVVDLIAKELAAQTQKRVLRVEAAAFQDLYLADPNHISKHCEDTEIENLLTLSMTRSTAAVAARRGRRRASDWESSPEHRTACLNALRWNFDYVLIDCSSTAVSSEATTLAQLVDGVSVVVKAAQTRRGQIQRCQQMIEGAGGKFLGFILNQRQYPVPDWLYRRL
jgi:succinoglycan biosynthesis transport protein ExoP